MTLRIHRIGKLAPVALIACAIAIVAYGFHRSRQPEKETVATPARVGVPGGPSTSREELDQTIERMEARLKSAPADPRAAVLLADALLRQTRVSGNAGLAVRAERALAAVLENDPMDYDARRMLGAVYLSQHRFREAIREGERARDQHPRDAWNYGVIGDGHLERGEYDEAFAAFQTMVDLRPNAASYARAAYAAELQGNLNRALASMRMSAEATSPGDPESLAWHYSQIGELLLQLGRIPEAQREFKRAHYIFPEHPFAVLGLAHADEAAGDYPTALRRYLDQFQKRPAPDLAAKIGDLQEALGEHREAGRYYALAEAGWRFDSPEPAALARFLADRDDKIEEALAFAATALAERHDIFTEDAFAWTSFKAGRLDDAGRTIELALRTGTRDRSILYHAAAIRLAKGDSAGARTIFHQLDAGPTRADPRLRSAIEALRPKVSGPARLVLLTR